MRFAKLRPEFAEQAEIRKAPPASGLDSFPSPNLLCTDSLPNADMARPTQGPFRRLGAKKERPNL